MSKELREKNKATETGTILSIVDIKKNSKCASTHGLSQAMTSKKLPFDATFFQIFFLPLSSIYWKQC